MAAASSGILFVLCPFGLHIGAIAPVVGWGMLLSGLIASLCYTTGMLIGLIAWARFSLRVRWLVLHGLMLLIWGGMLIPAWALAGRLLPEEEPFRATFYTALPEPYRVVRTWFDDGSVDGSEGSSMFADVNTWLEIDLHGAGVEPLLQTLELSPLGDTSWPWTFHTPLWWPAEPSAVEQLYWSGTFGGGTYVYVDADSDRAYIYNIGL